MKSAFVVGKKQIPTFMPHHSVEFVPIHSLKDSPFCLTHSHTHSLSLPVTHTYHKHTHAAIAWVSLSPNHMTQARVEIETKV